MHKITDPGATQPFDSLNAVTELCRISEYLPIIQLNACFPYQLTVLNRCLDADIAEDTKAQAASASRQD